MQSFPLLLDPSGKPDHQAIHCPAANFANFQLTTIERQRH